MCKASFPFLPKLDPRYHKRRRTGTSTREIALHEALHAVVAYCLRFKIHAICANKDNGYCSVYLNLKNKSCLVKAIEVAVAPECYWKMTSCQTYPYSMSFGDNEIIEKILVRVNKMQLVYDQDLITYCNNKTTKLLKKRSTRAAVFALANVLHKKRLLKGVVAERIIAEHLPFVCKLGRYEFDKMNAKVI